MFLSLILNRTACQAAKINAATAKVRVNQKPLVKKIIKIGAALSKLLSGLLILLCFFKSSAERVFIVLANKTKYTKKHTIPEKLSIVEISKFTLMPNV